MTDLFDIIKLHGLSFEQKINLILDGKHLLHFSKDVDPIVRDYAHSQQKKQTYRRINAKLKKLGWQKWMMTTIRKKCGTG